MLLEIFEVLRLLNIGLSAMACTLLLMTLVRRWDVLDGRVRRIGLWLCGLLVYMVYEMAEGIALELETGPRVPVLTLLLLGLVIQIVWNSDLADSRGSHSRRSERHN